jgi:hypothetical protein
MFSLSLNPPKQENVSIQDFENAIARVEEKLGLTGQPRAIVFHEKKSRRHCHVVWSRIDTKNMKAIPLPHYPLKLKSLSRELYLHHGWKMPKGYMHSKERDPNNFTLAQWQQARRVGKNTKDIKTALLDCWAISDSQASFAQALKEHGFVLAKGDRRGFLAVDHKCEKYSLSKWLKPHVTDITQRLNDKETLPTFEQAKSQIAKDMAGKLHELEEYQTQAIVGRIKDIEQIRQQMVESHRKERADLQAVQQQRQVEEIKVRQARFNKGLRGLFDIFNGRRKKIKKQNERDTQLAALRDREEKDTVIFTQLEERRKLQIRIERLQGYREKRAASMSHDIEQYQAIQRHQQEKFKAQPNLSQNHNRKGPQYER